MKVRFMKCVYELEKLWEKTKTNNKQFKTIKYETIYQENLCIMEFNISMNLSEFKLIYPVINLLLAFPNQIW